MKNLIFNFFVFLCLFSLFRCTNDNVKYNGSPVGRLVEESIIASISTQTLFVLPGQDVEFTVTLPAGFRDKVTGAVTIEASSFSIGGGVRKSSIVIPADANSAIGKVIIGTGGKLFESATTVSLTGILLENPIIGKQLSITSNVLTIDSGSSSVPAENSKRMRVLIDWENKNTLNGMKCSLTRVGSTAITFKNPKVGTTSVNINGVPYVAVFSTNLATSATNFSSLVNASPVLAALGISSTSSGSSVILNYTIKPNITISDNANFSATKFDTADILGLEDNKLRVIDVYVSEIVSSKGSPKKEASDYVFNAGKYILKFRPSSSSSLEQGLVNLKYRLILRFPDGKLKIFNGVYNNVATVPEKTILTFTKIGLGDNTIFDDVIPQ